MAFISGQHIPRRTFLRGMGGTVALPFLDAMIPAGRVWRAEEDQQDAPGVYRGGARHRRVQRVGSQPVLVGSGGARPRLHREPRERAGTVRALPGLPDHHQQYRLPHGGGVQRAGDRRRPLPLDGGLADAGAPEADPRAPTSTWGPRSTRCTRSVSARTRPCRRCSSASSRQTRRAVVGITTTVRTRMR